MNNKLKLVLFAITPFIIGNLFNLIALSGISALFLIFSILFCVYWLWVGFISYKLTDSKVQSLLIGNSFGIVTIIVLLVMRLVFQSYLPGFIGFQLQMYFLPATGVASRILTILFKSVSMIGVFGASFVLMVLIYYVGFIVSRKRN